MLRILASFCLIGVAATGAPAWGQAAPAAAAARLADDPEFEGATRLFSAWLDTQMAYRGLPGVMVGVVHDQQLVWQKGFGFADVKAKAPMTAETKFRMASHSKMLTAIAVMQLREQGKLRLDDPVQQHLPWFRSQPAGADDGPITVEQLLSHSSGLQREASDHWSSLDFPTEAELKALMADRQSALAPQVRWKYSNLAYGVAGLLVEELSGQRFAAFAQANILGPLGMTDSSFDRPVPGLAVPYGRRLPDGSREILPFVDARGMAAATGLTSDLTDMAKFVSAQFRRGPSGGAQILSSGSMREMQRVRSVEENWASGTGLGFGTLRIRDKSFVGHAGGYPGYTTQTLFQPGEKWGVIVLTNTNDSDPGQIARQLIEAVGPLFAKAAAPPAGVAWDPGWARFQGVYRNRSNDISIVLLNGRLVALSSTAPGVDNVTRLEPLGGGRFRIELATGNNPPLGEVAWFEEKAGKPTRLWMGDNWSGPGCGAVAAGLPGISRARRGGRSGRGGRFRCWRA
jgi:CubicO group peptidase (beta-lactamase class C family)